MDPWPHVLSVVTSVISILASGYVTWFITYKQKQLDASHARAASLIQALLAREHAAHAASQQRRLQAFERLWKTVLGWSRVFPQTFGLLDSVLHENYASVRKDLGDIDKNTDYEAVVKAFDEPYVEERLFVPDALWECVRTYEQFIIGVWSRDSGSEPALVPWYKDTELSTLVMSALPDDYDRIMSLPRGKLAEVRRLLEMNILREIQKAIAGENDSHEVRKRYADLYAEIDVSRKRSFINSLRNAERPELNEKQGRTRAN